METTIKSGCSTYTDSRSTLPAGQSFFTWRSSASFRHCSLKGSWPNILLRADKTTEQATQYHRQ
ncbi:Uncharacterised protein [Vibrio cholerae]|nr:Uncharacterised protein [Vibrio cholerae]